jgi:hypothetical protein
MIAAARKTLMRGLPAISLHTIGAAATPTGRKARTVGADIAGAHADEIARERYLPMAVDARSERFVRGPDAGRVRLRMSGVLPAMARRRR